MPLHHPDSISRRPAKRKDVPLRAEDNTLDITSSPPVECAPVSKDAGAKGDALNAGDEDDELDEWGMPPSGQRQR